MWGVINGLYLLVGLPITHKYLLPRQTGSWLRFDVLPPLAAAFVVAGIGRAMLFSDQSTVLMLITIGSIWLLATIGAALSATQVRGTIRQLTGIRF